jgi:D-glycero-D-manno-heptose 1,7-bisphosphate phosphatase
MKLVILDRDGVINQESTAYIKTPEEFIPIPDSIEAIVKLSKAGYTIAIATNQSGVARGLLTEATLQSIHDKLCAQVEQLGGRIDKIVYCPHHPVEFCACRKPRAGMLEQIAEHFGCDLTDIPFIGDSLRDVQAARTVGCKPLFVLTGMGKEIFNRQRETLEDVLIFDNLAHAVSHVLAESK